MSTITEATSTREIKTARYIKHRDEMLEYQKRYNAENHDTYVNYQKEYYQRTKEKKKARYNTTFQCEYCDKPVRKGSYAVHCRTKLHIRNKCTVKMPLVAALDDDVSEWEVIVYVPIAK